MFNEVYTCLYIDIDKRSDLEHLYIGKDAEWVIDSISIGEKGVCHHVLLSKAVVQWLKWPCIVISKHDCINDICLT